MSTSTKTRMLVTMSLDDQVNVLAFELMRKFTKVDAAYKRVPVEEVPLGMFFELCPFNIKDVAVGVIDRFTGIRFWDIRKGAKFNAIKKLHLGPIWNLYYPGYVNDRTVYNLDEFVQFDDRSSWASKIEERFFLMSSRSQGYTNAITSVVVFVELMLSTDPNEKSEFTEPLPEAKFKALIKAIRKF